MAPKKASNRKVRNKPIENDIKSIDPIPKWELDFKINCDFEFKDIHKSFLELVNNYKTKMVIVDGPAGTSKTYLAVLSALTHILKNNANQIVYIRSIVESASRSFGALPGELDEKFAPWSMPLLDKLDELIGASKGGSLMEKGYIKCVPVNFTRGLTFHDSIVIVDESQNMTQEELITILTRFGENSKYIVIGDTFQSDIKGRSGFAKIFNAFDNDESDEQGIFTFKFTAEDIVRSKILKFIITQLEKM